MPELTKQDRHVLILERQHLMKSTLAPRDMIHHLGGLQAQEKLGPYFGLAARIPNFTAADLDSLRADKAVLRGTFQRRTVHLLDSRHFAAWHCLYEDRARTTAAREGLTLPRTWRDQFRAAFEPGQALASAEILSMAKTLFDRNIDRFSKLNMVFMGGLGLVRTFGEDGKSLGPQEKWTFFEDFTGGVLATDTDAALYSMVQTYLGAFGPATASDFAAWSGLLTPRKAMEEWADQDLLWTGTDEQGRTLYDLPHLSRTPSTDSVDRFQVLGDFDNLILSHQDRTHVMDRTHHTRMNRNLRCMNPILKDGWMVGVWDVRATKARGVTVKLEPYVSLSASERKELADLALHRVRTVLPDEPDPDLSWA